MHLLKVHQYVQTHTHKHTHTSTTWERIISVWWVCEKVYQYASCSHFSVYTHILIHFSVYTHTLMHKGCGLDCSSSSCGTWVGGCEWEFWYTYRYTHILMHSITHTLTPTHPASAAATTAVGATSFVHQYVCVYTKVYQYVCVYTKVYTLKCDTVYKLECE